MRLCVLPVVFFLTLLLQIPAMAAQQFADGQYIVDVTLSGGSGRATVDSPAVITVDSGEMEVVIIWSSPYYEHMLVDGVYYYPVNTDGNAIFEIPVLLDMNIDVSAQTIAMSVPHQIDYVLYFDSATLKPLSDDAVASQAYIAIALIAAVIVLPAGVGMLRRTKKPRATGGEPLK